MRKKVRQGALTVLAPIRPGRDEMEALKRYLEAIRRRVNRNEGRGTPLGFEKVTTLHYARFVILDEHRPSAGELQSEPLLLISTQYDGSLRDHLEELIDHGEPALAEILSHCAGFDAETGPDERRIYNYLKRHSHRAHALFKGTPWRSVGRILWEQEVAGWIRTYAAEELSPDVDPTEAWRLIRAHVSAKLERGDRPTAEATYGKGCAESAHWVRWQRRSVRVWTTVWSLPFWIPILGYYFLPKTTMLVVLGIVVAGLRLRIEEDSDAEALANQEGASSHAVRNQLLGERDKMLGKHEDIWSQNQLTLVSTVKPSPLRRALLRAVLFVVDVRARFKFTEGLLHGLPTIHFAYWMLFDRGRRLLFVSNYDDSWAGYLDDFIQHSPRALTGIWSHAEGFPATRFLFWRGASDGRRFKAWARADQVPPEVWYSAYPWLSTENINCNSRLVEGLNYRGFADPKRRDETFAWLALI